MGQAVQQDGTGQKAVSRQERRRSDTRGRLLRAALEVMARKGPDTTTIQEITDAADVGFGSFYNHFKSKEDIQTAVMDQLMEHFGDIIDGRVADIADPAEAMAAAIRLAFRQLAAEPTWADFLLRQFHDLMSLERGLGRRLSRDLARGAAGGRFILPDGDASIIAVCGAAAALLAAQRAGRLGDSAPERAAAAILHLAGVPAEEAAAIAARPLPTDLTT